MIEISPEMLQDKEKVVTKMNRVAEIIRTYYPESSPDWAVWIPGTFEGFEVVGLVVEDELNASLNIEFSQDSDEEGFPLNPYRLIRVEFYGKSTEENSYRDIAYFYADDDTGDNWMTEDTPTQPDKVVSLCREIFKTLRRLAISYDFGRVFLELPPEPERFDAQHSKTPGMSAEQLAELTEAIKRSLPPGWNAYDEWEEYGLLNID